MISSSAGRSPIVGLCLPTSNGKITGIVMKRYRDILFYLLSFLILLAVVSSEGINYFAAEHPSCWWVAGLLAAYTLLLVSERWVSRRLGGYIQLYLICQTCITLLLLLFPTSPDFLAALFIPLIAQAMRSLPQKMGLAWISAFILIMAGVFLYHNGLSRSALSLISIYTAVYLFVGAYVTLTRQAEAAHRKSEALREDLQAAYEQLQTYAAQAEVLTATQERARLARELHDSVAQTLFGTTLVTETLRLMLEPASDQVSAQLDKLQAQTKDALAEMRSLISQWRSVATMAGLVPALRHHLALRHKQDGLEVRLTLDGERPLPPDHEHALFRIAQEALNNVSKHAQTQQAVVDISFADEAVTLAVRDEGAGFNLADINPDGVHMGLSSMRERAEAIGGELSITSHPGAGTRVVVTVLKNQKYTVGNSGSNLHIEESWKKGNRP